MLKKFLITLFIFFQSLFLFAFDFSSFNFFIQDNNGITYTKLGEYLYSTSNKQQKVSYLEWQQPAFYTAGVKTGISWKDLQFKGNFNYLFPTINGYMHDLDWAGDLQTNFAFFDNYAVKNYNWNAEISYSFNFDNHFSIAPVIRYYYFYNSFHAKNGYGYYGNASISKTGENVAWDSSDARRGKCSDITYEREGFILFAGFESTLKYEKWKFIFRILLNPYGEITSHDYHADLKNEGNDYSMYAFTKSIFNMFNFEAGISYNFFKTFDLIFGIKADFTQVTQGLLATNYWYRQTLSNHGFMDTDEPDFRLSGQPSGISSFSFTGNIGFRYRFR